MRKQRSVRPAVAWLLSKIAARFHGRLRRSERGHDAPHRGLPPALFPPLPNVQRVHAPRADDDCDGDIFAVLSDHELSGTMRHALFEAMSNGGGPAVDTDCPARCYDKPIVWEAMRELRSAGEETVDSDDADGQEQPR